ncbi:MAG: sugar phosphate isomerase/epimerase [Clostridiales bacterium]|jgi:sugar phosphate isomerase/epimerase|nr:sugar phosphate isomerase/epimerase [Clostridiales bacterium]
MSKKWHISGFADEISPDFEFQLQTVAGLGMDSICLRSANGRNIAEYQAPEAEKELLPLLRRYGVRVSCIGSPIGKIPLNDEAAFRGQLGMLEKLCKICGILRCETIRVFSFYIPEGVDADGCFEQALDKSGQFSRIARRHGMTLLHENEKKIYGDTGRRCLRLLESLGDPHYRAAFDYANFIQCGEDPAICWAMLAAYVRDIHIKDAVYGSGENVVCGAGDGKIAELLLMALQGGFGGPLTLEPHLVQFDSLAYIEPKTAGEAFIKDKAETGAQAYEMQYRALAGILRGCQ